MTSVVVGLLIVAALTANDAQEADGFGSEGRSAAATEASGGQAMIQALSGFGLLGVWIIAGAVLAAKANPGRKLVFGAAPNARSTTTEESVPDQGHDQRADAGGDQEPEIGTGS